MGTLVVGLSLLVVIAAIIAGMVSDKKKGKSIGCGEDCAHCGGCCNRND